MTNFLLDRFIFFEAFESQSQMGKGAPCPNLNVFGFFRVDIRMRTIKI